MGQLRVFGDSFSGPTDLHFAKGKGAARTGVRLLPMGQGVGSHFPMRGRYCGK